MQPTPIIQVTETTRICAARCVQTGRVLRDALKPHRTRLVVWRGFSFARYVLL